MLIAAGYGVNNPADNNLVKKNNLRMVKKSVVK